MTSLVRRLCLASLIGVVIDAFASKYGWAHEWLSYNGDNYNQRYAALDQINTSNISRLGAVWVSDPFFEGATSRMTPLVHNRRMFLAAGPRIYALDARTGKVLWAHVTETRKPPGAATGLASMMSGLAITRSFGLGLGGGMIFAGMMNGHVIALRESSGDVVWDKLISTEPLSMARGITCPPLYIDGVLYFGLGIEYTRGEIIAIEARSGRVLWRASTIPEPGHPGHETWPQGSEIWRSGGGHPWAAPAADPALGLLYFVTGNAGPASGGKVRPGDNLYTVSLIAVEMKTGRFRWYRQLIHHDIWEADLSIPPVLFDIQLASEAHKAIAVLRGDGYLFTFDRSTGEPLVPIDERPVPQNPTLFTASTQPFPRGADSILAPCESWRNKLPAGFVLGCMFDPSSREVPNRLAPYASVRIASMSYNRQTGYVYTQGTNSLRWLGSGEDPYLSESIHASMAHVPNAPLPGVVIAAIDPHTGKVEWKKDLPSFDDSGYKSNGGALSTAGGLVFHQGGDGTLQAYDAHNGETLWRFQTDFAAGDASPMSYAADGKEYVAFIAGTKVWAFALGGQLPQAAPIAAPAQEEVTGPIVDTDQIETLTLESGVGISHHYRLDEYAFNPYRTRVRAGTSVTFINNGYLPHTIVAVDGSWTTGTLAPTQLASVTFAKPGKYLYTSKEYPWSYGQVIVTADTASTGRGVESQEGSPESAQVSLGQSLYAVSCSGCHGENLSGRDPAPALTGRGFSSRWMGRDALGLFERVRTTMPLNAPGSLSEDGYAAIVAYILYSNNHAAPFVLNRQNMTGLAITTN